MRSLLLTLCLCLVVSVASAQSTGVSAGYVRTHTDFENPHLSVGDGISGWFGGVDVPIAANVSVMARVDGQYGDVFRQGPVIQPLGQDARPFVYAVTAGPRFAVVSGSGLAGFVDALFGVAHGKARSMGVDALSAIDDTKLVGGIGGGIELPIQRHLDVQLDLQYRRTNLFDQTLNLVQVGAAVVIRPGRR